MEVDRNELAENYANLSDDELLDMHAAGTLTEMANEVLEGELVARGITIPKRSDASVVARGRPQSLRAHWQGQASLASAFWILLVIGMNVLSVLVNLLMIRGNQLVIAISYTVWGFYYIFVLVSIWRCAWNTSWKGWGYLARIYAITAPVLIIVLLGMLVTLEM